MNLNDIFKQLCPDDRANPKGIPYAVYVSWKNPCDYLNPNHRDNSGGARCLRRLRAAEFSLLRDVISDG